MAQPAADGHYLILSSLAVRKLSPGSGHSIQITHKHTCTSSNGENADEKIVPTSRTWCVTLCCSVALYCSEYEYLYTCHSFQFLAVLTSEVVIEVNSP